MRFTRRDMMMIEYLRDYEVLELDSMSAVTGAFSAACGVTSAVPHGGLVVALFKATNYMSLYLLSVILGTAVSVAIVLAFKKKQNFR